MTLTQLRGTPKNTNNTVLRLAAEHRPSLIIDCSRAANPYNAPWITREIMHDIYVVEVEMLYKFRDTIKNLPNLIKQTHAQTVLVTDTSTLFNYDNDEENRAIRRNAWKRLKYVAKNKTVYVVNKIMFQKT